MPLFEPIKQDVPTSLLKERYRWLPFSILNTISHDWQRRNDDWVSLFGTSTSGRELQRYNATPINTFSSRGQDAKIPNSVSEFDPFLAELMIRWFSLDGMHVLDPFAGGCVRGVVSSVLNRQYTGIDISPEQVNVNREQWQNIVSKYPGLTRAPEWIIGNSLTTLPELDTIYDMVFTCPPYFNLEMYTDIPGDISLYKDYSLFLNDYASILCSSAKLLRDNSFYVIVVSEVRARQVGLSNSEYVGLVPDTIHILRDKAKLKYYNEIILENNIGSLPIRAPKYFDKNRKIGRHHQNILVFYKGDILEIEKKFGKLN